MTEKAQIPQKCREECWEECRERGTAGWGTAGSSAFSLLFQRNRPPSTALSSPPSSPLFPGVLPSTLPGTFWDLDFPSPVAGAWDSNPVIRNQQVKFSKLGGFRWDIGGLLQGSKSPFSLENSDKSLKRGSRRLSAPDSEITSYATTPNPQARVGVQR